MDLRTSSTVTPLEHNHDQIFSSAERRQQHIEENEMIERNIEKEVDALKMMYASLFEVTKSIIEENKNLAQLILDVSEVACGRGRSSGDGISVRA